MRISDWSSDVCSSDLLCVPIQTKEVAGKVVRSIGGGALIACLADGLSKETVETLANGIVAWRKELAPAVDTRVVFKDSGFADDVAKSNIDRKSTRLNSSH